MLEFQGLIFEKLEISRVVENLDPHHHKTRIVPSGDPDIVQIIKPNTKLRANQWIGRWIKLSRNTVRLEAKNSSCDKFNIISPSSYNWVSFN
jgi:hypothetical protein